ncbi:MAG: hypothetical protein ABL883_15405 [Terricaulis sp.]
MPHGRVIGAALILVFLSACNGNQGAPALLAMRAALDQEVREAVTVNFDPAAEAQRSEWFTASLVQRGYFQVSPNPNSAPWYVVSMSPSGVARLREAQQAGLFAIAAFSSSPLECWQAGETQNCAADVTVQVRPAGLPDVMGQSLIPISGRMTASYNPRIGHWRVSDTRFPNGGVSRPMQQFLMNKLGERVRDPSLVLQTEISAAQAQAFQMIEARLRPEIYVNGSVVTSTHQDLDFLRQRVRGASWQAISDACSSSQAAGGGWRLAQRPEFDAILADGRPSDTPDNRIWGDMFLYVENPQNPRQNDIWFNSFFWHGRAARLSLDEVLAIGYGPRGRMLWVASTAISRGGHIGGYGGNIPEPPDEPFSLRAQRRSDQEEAVLYRALARQAVREGQPSGVCVRPTRAHSTSATTP